MTWDNNAEQQTEFIGTTDTFSDVVSKSNSNIVQLFSIGTSKEKKEKKTKPFIHQVRFHGPRGKIVRVWANIDNGTMKEVMSSAMFRKVKHRMGTAAPSSQLLQVANGTIIRSEARWEGCVDINGIDADVAFEVFDSGGKWDFLFGKTLLETFKAVHNYESDEITVHGKKGNVTLSNQSHIARTPQPTTQPSSTTLIQVCVITDNTQPHEDEELTEVDIEALKKDTNLFT